jgi:hypothetical protein
MTDSVLLLTDGPSRDREAIIDTAPRHHPDETVAQLTMSDIYRRGRLDRGRSHFQEAAERAMPERQTFGA